LAILAITKTDDSLIAPFLILFYQKLKIKKAFFLAFFFTKQRQKIFTSLIYKVNFSGQFCA